MALSTTRHGGVSHGPFASCNLGTSTDDSPEAITANRRRLEQCLPASPCWLKQVHGVNVIHLDDWQPGVSADAAWTDRPGQVAIILTADCLPILLAADDGRLVAAIHAGWRGLAAGIIERTISQLPVAGAEIHAWIGPGISQPHYEVDQSVRSVFARRSSGHEQAFRRNARDRYQADLKQIARLELQAAGLTRVMDSGLCTAGDPERFYSHRRDQARTGRQATLVWLAGG